ncbi:MAG: saccharopine dehydrogenase family protein [Candidatus Bathyarchaeia archaeon]
MRIVTLGCGYVGSVLAGELAETMPSAEIVISDNDPRRARETSERIGRSNVYPLQLDVSDDVRLAQFLRRFDLAVGLTPGRLGYRALKASIEAGVNMVDLSYMPEDPLALNKEASEAGVTVIPDCGLAPGLSNILVGRAVSLLDEVLDVQILVGGLPERPIPPLGYLLTWSVEDLMQEYVRRAKIIKDGRLVEVDALDGLEEVEFPGVGRLEAFYTDGVRTLLHTVKGVRNMWEKTLRYSGHAGKMRLLKDLGFLDESPLEVNGLAVAPWKVTAKLLEKKLSAPGVKDLVAMRVEVSGLKDGSEACYVYRLLDRYDEARNITAMGRTTAYTASTVVQLLAKGTIEERGVIPPERLGMRENIFGQITLELRRRGIEARVENR